MHSLLGTEIEGHLHYVKKLSLQLHYIPGYTDMRNYDNEEDEDEWKKITELLSWVKEKFPEDLRLTVDVSMPGIFPMWEPYERYLKWKKSFERFISLAKAHRRSKVWVVLVESTDSGPAGDRVPVFGPGLQYEFDDCWDCLLTMTLTGSRSMILRKLTKQ